MVGVVGEHGGLQRPVLVDLAGELHEVTGHVGARQARVAHIGQQPVEGVAELVEHRRHLVEAEQRLLPRGRPGDVQHVDDHRGLTDEVVLVDEAAHPGATTLGRAGPRIEQEQADRTLPVADLPDRDIRVVADEILPRDDVDAVEPVRGEESAVTQHPVEREVLHQLRLVDVELLGTQLCIPVGQVGLGQPRVRAADRGLVRRPLVLAERVGDRRRRHPVEQVVDRGHGAGGLLLGDEGRVVGVAEQFGPPGAQPHGLQHDVVVAGLPGSAAAGRRSLGDAPSGRRIRQLLEHRLDTGQSEPDEPTVLPGLLGIGTQLVLPGAAQPRQLLLRGEQHRTGVGGGDEAASERGGELGEPGVDTAEFLPARLVEVRATPPELPQPVFQQCRVLTVLRLRRHGFHPRIQALVEVDGGDVPGQFGGDGLLGGDDVGGGVRPRVVEDDGQHPLEQLSAGLEGLHRVLPGRRFRVRHDGGDLRLVVGDGGAEGGHQVGDVDVGEVGQFVVEDRRFEQRIHGPHPNGRAG